MRVFCASHSISFKRHERNYHMCAAWRTTRLTPMEIYNYTDFYIAWFFVLRPWYGFYRGKSHISTRLSLTHVRRTSKRSRHIDAMRKSSASVSLKASHTKKMCVVWKRVGWCSCVCMQVRYSIYLCLIYLVSRRGRTNMLPVILPTGL